METRSIFAPYKSIMENQPSNKKSKDAIYITIIVLLLCGTGFAYYSMSQYRSNYEVCSANTAKMEADIVALNDMLKNSGMSDIMGDDLNESLNNLLAEYKNIETNNVEMQDSIAKQIHAIDSLQQLAQRHKGDAYMIYKLKKESETLRAIMIGYVHTIDSLNTMNQELRTNLNVKEKELVEVKDERDNVKNKNKELETKVAKGSVLQVSGLSSGAIHIRSSGTQVETTRAGRADKVKACCTILENPIAKSGAKNIYMVVTMPNATVLTADPNATFKWDGGESQYSLMREIDYQNAQMDLCLYADAVVELPKGVYNVELFCEKAKIGKTSFTLK